MNTSFFEPIGKALELVPRSGWSLGVLLGIAVLAAAWMLVRIVRARSQLESAATLAEERLRSSNDTAGALAAFELISRSAARSHHELLALALFGLAAAGFVAESSIWDAVLTFLSAYHGAANQNLNLGTTPEIEAVRYLGALLGLATSGIYLVAAASLGFLDRRARARVLAAVQEAPARAMPGLAPPASGRP